MDGNQFNAEGRGAAGSFTSFMLNIFPNSLQSVKTNTLKRILRDAQELQKQLQSETPDLKASPLRFYLRDLVDTYPEENLAGKDLDDWIDNTKPHINADKKESVLKEITALHDSLQHTNEQQKLGLELEKDWGRFAEQIPFLDGRDQEMLKFKNG